MSEKNHNQQTLHTYGTKLQEYIDSTPSQINEADRMWLRKEILKADIDKEASI